MRRASGHEIISMPYDASSARVWRCADGRKMLIVQMTDGHLARAIEAIKRGHDAQGREIGFKTRALLPVLELEQIRRQGLWK